jgi:endonuclease/exonuclease/phosphatase family metal-dependent hydrolase
MTTTTTTRTRTRRTRRVLAAAAVAGAALLAPAMLASSAQAATPVKVLSYNINQLSIGKKSSDPFDTRAGWAEEVIRSRNADVVILNEAFNGAAEDLVESLKDLYPYATPNVGRYCDLAKRKGWDSASGPCSSSPFVIRGGVVVLSKDPILEQHQLVYENSSRDTWDWNANKGAALVKIDRGGTPVWVAGTHLQADEDEVEADVRRAQLDELWNWASAKVKESGGSGTVLLGGDLNMPYYAGEAANAPSGFSLGTATWETGTPSVNCERNRTRCEENDFEVNAPNAYRDSLDYLGYLRGPQESGFVSPAGQPTVTAIETPEGKSASDHYPVEATFQVG